MPKAHSMLEYKYQICPYNLCQATLVIKSSFLGEAMLVLDALKYFCLNWESSTLLTIGQVNATAVDSMTSELQSHYNHMI